MSSTPGIMESSQAARGYSTISNAFLEYEYEFKKFRRLQNSETSQFNET